MVTSVLNALHHLRNTGQIMSARLSLAATAELLKQFKAENSPPTFGPEFRPEGSDDVLDEVHDTAWGPARRLIFPMQVDQINAYWDTPETPLHTAEPVWLQHADK